MQRGFNTVNHTIFSKKLIHYGIRGVTNKWFQSFQEDRKQISSVKGSESAVKTIKQGVPQGSGLGSPFLFCLLMICSRRLNLARYIHFADDTNLFLIAKFLKKNNKDNNRDLKLTVESIRANKLSLHASNTEIVLFKPKTKKITKQLNIRVSGQKIKESLIFGI